MKTPINFFRGHPTSSLLPYGEIAEASVRVMRKFQERPDLYEFDGSDNRGPLEYGNDFGNTDIREIIAKWNDSWFKKSSYPFSETDVNVINITGGASSGATTILNQCTHPKVTKQVFVVTPTYFLVNSLLIDAGLGGKLTAIEEDDQGQIDLEELERLLLKYTDPDEKIPIDHDIMSDRVEGAADPSRAPRKFYRFAMYLIPTFSNPKGGVLDYEHREALVELARKYDVLLISDDVYDYLRYDGSELLPRLSTIDRATRTSLYGNTVANCTFSKLVGPGLRVGWQETASPQLTEILSQGGFVKSGGAAGQMSSFLVADLITTGTIDKIIHHLNGVYQQRANTLKHLLDTYLPKGTTYTGGNGGYFMWVTLPDEYDTRSIVKDLSANYDVLLASGDKCEVEGDCRHWGLHSVRLCLSYLTEEEMTEGVKIWGRVCEAHIITG
ncbi:BA75_04143T0 [Komagataella pastoris]|uniref:BA75_04143T0 n=1 Tax=Komagataella pastoris TaxID=4922 RepID=A0A1B2JGK9_PICPA|nr:BA75_04143T0 [Komagataella pastoris]